MSSEKIALRPLYDRVLVRRKEEEERTGGGIYIPETAKEKPYKGVVVAVGKGRRGENGEHLPLEVKVNDEILFGKYSGSEVKMGTEELLVMKEEEILGIIN